MKTKTEIERAIITLLCSAYDKGMHSTGYYGGDVSKRNSWVMKQLENIYKWYDKDDPLINEKEVISSDWLINHNFKPLYPSCEDCYSYESGGSFSFFVHKVNGKWCAEIGKEFTNDAYGLEYIQELESIFFLLTGKGFIKKRQTN